MACLMRLLIVISILLVAQCRRKDVDSKNGRSSERNVKEQTMDSVQAVDSVIRHYDRSVAPAGDGRGQLKGGKRATVITVSVEMLKVSEIDEHNGQLRMTFYLRQKWIDSQLAHNGVGTDSIQMKADSIWIPDTFFANEISAERHMIDQPNQFVKVSPDGAVAYSTKLSLILSCDMYFERFPFDEQTCTSTLRSFEYSANELEYKWEDSPLLIMPNPLTGDPPFTISDVATSDGEMVTSSTSSYSYLKFTMKLKRKVRYYQIRYILPTTMLVILSWCAFWIHPSRVGARVTVGILALLAITALGFCQDFPRTAYIKAIDYWMTGTMCLAFLAFIETILVSALHSRRLESEEDVFSTSDLEKLPIVDECSGTTVRFEVKATRPARWVDNISKIALPLALALLMAFVFLKYGRH